MATPLVSVAVQNTQQLGCAAELAGAQHGQTFHQAGGVLEEHIVAQEPLFGGHDHAVHTRQRRVKSRHPVGPGRGHAGGNEVLPIEGQHHVDFSATGQGSFDQDEVRAAGGRGVNDGPLKRLELALQGFAHSHLQRGWKARRSAIGAVDHVPCKGHHRGGGQERQQLIGQGQQRC